MPKSRDFSGNLCSGICQTSSPTVNIFLNIPTIHSGVITTNATATKKLIVQFGYDTPRQNWQAQPIGQKHLNRSPAGSPCVVV